MTRDTEHRSGSFREEVLLDDLALHLPTSAEQRTARIMGAWFLGTFLFSIPAFFFYGPILDDADFIVGTGNDTRIAIGAMLEILLAVSGIATAVVIYPIVKRVSESVALGYVAARTVESILILIGVLSLMAVVALHQDLASATGWVRSSAPVPVTASCSVT